MKSLDVFIMTEPRESDLYIEQVELGEDKTASLRFANLSEFNAIICRLNWPHREGLVIPFDSLKEESTCSHDECTCQRSSIERTINTLKLCRSCIQAIHQKIKNILDNDPQYPLIHSL